MQDFSYALVPLWRLSSCPFLPNSGEDLSKPSPACLPFRLFVLKTKTVGQQHRCEVRLNFSHAQHELTNSDRSTEICTECARVVFRWKNQVQTIGKTQFR